MKKQEIESFLVSEEEVGLRLDKLLANHYKETKSRTYFEDLIEQGRVLVNGNLAKKRIFPRKDDFIEIDFLFAAKIDLVGEEIPLAIVYEDESIIVINKPAGMVVHPAPGNWSGTLVNALLFHCTGLRNIVPTSIDEPLLRPGIVHRLDKDTSGIIVAAKNSLAHEKLVSMFANRTVKKEYFAICVGNPGNKTFSSNIERDPIHRKR